MYFYLNSLFLKFNPVPYGCARAGLMGANLCMYSPSGTNVGSLINLINDQGAAGNIDSPSNLQGQNVYVFHGTRDTTVNPRKIFLFNFTQH